MTLQKITGATLWLGSIDAELENPARADIGLTINDQQHSSILSCLETGADISIRLTPEAPSWLRDPAGGMEISPAKALGDDPDTYEGGEDA